MTNLTDWKTCEQCKIYQDETHDFKNCAIPSFYDEWLKGQCGVCEASLEKGYHNVGWSMLARNLCSPKCVNKYGMEENFFYSGEGNEV